MSYLPRYVRAAHWVDRQQLLTRTNSLPDMGAPFTIIDPKDVPAEQFPTSETAVRKLTEPLGCQEMRLNQVIVESGEITTPHTHNGQEEVFMALTAGQIAIDGEVHDVPPGNIVRVEAEMERNLLNQTADGPHIWLAIGAPPVGSIEDYGSYVLTEDSEV